MKLTTPTSPDWNAIAALSRDAFQVAVNEWIGRASIRGGKVSGPTAILPPGSLVSDVDVAARVTKLLAASKVPPPVATAIARVLGAAWTEWAMSFELQVPKAFPSFAAVPVRTVPLTRSMVSPPLALGLSKGESALKSAVLTNRLVSALRAAAAPQAGDPTLASKALATGIETSFDQWKRAVRLTNLAGSGSAPTFAPPYVPVGVVTVGQTVNVGPLFAGPLFGAGVR